MSYQIPQIPFAGAAEEGAIIVIGNARFTILTSRMIRIEYDPKGTFEDRPSQVFWYRKQAVPEYKAVQKKNNLEIDTGDLLLKYTDTPKGFSASTLSIKVNRAETTWHFGDRDPYNLKGTGRTLDNADGAIPLENGLMSRSGWAVVDDSQTFVFNDQGWLELRESPKLRADSIDIVFFGYGDQYLECLKDYCKVAGNVPLIPRWILGNWWSRYWEYSQEELTNLMKEFRQREIPLSVCIIDMDWHITKTGNTSSGWTGYTWNKDLFPTPYQFIDWLHQQGLKTGMNLHPAEGIHPHEEAYEQMAKFMGMDPAEKEPVSFNIADPKFTQGYFEVLHHPAEAKGVDFWWMDWQQGVRLKQTEPILAQVLDPLWWLNHLHYYDQQRSQVKRGFIFSRWGGLGNHRYPIGFSGDSIVTWDSLAFQPYFTSTASNVAFGWWSHDIGGHYKGIEDGELFTRWVQFGVFSPILRIHCTKNVYQDRRPWNYDETTYTILKNCLQLRHALIPYLYSMAYRFTTQTIPPITPMYYHHQEEAAYHCPNQYYFGSEMIAAPYTTPINSSTRMSQQSVWLPEGSWYDFFTGERYSGNQWVNRYGTIDEIPVFAKAGAIVPLAPRTGWGGLNNPDQLDVHLFAGADGSFTLYEDDGETINYQQGHHKLTQMTQTWQENSLIIRVDPSEGDSSIAPASRKYQITIYGIHEPDEVEVNKSKALIGVPWQYDNKKDRLVLSPVIITNIDDLEITIKLASGSLTKTSDRRRENLVQSLQRFRLDSDYKIQIHNDIPNLLTGKSDLSFYSSWLTAEQFSVLRDNLKEE